MTLFIEVALLGDNYCDNNYSCTEIMFRLVLHQNVLGGVCIFYERNAVEQGSLAASKGKCFFLSICCSSDVAECNNLGSELLVLHERWTRQS